MTFLFRDLGTFAQDTWHIVPRLTHHVRTEVGCGLCAVIVPGPEFPAVTGFDLNDLSNLALLPAGTPPYRTNWGNIAPRIGLAYQVSESQRWQTVLRGGFGVFYDLATSEAGNGLPLPRLATLLDQATCIGLPFGGTATFPLSSAEAAPAPIAPPNVSNLGHLLHLIRISNRPTRCNGMLQSNKRWECNKPSASPISAPLEDVLYSRRTLHLPIRTYRLPNW